MSETCKTCEFYISSSKVEKVGVCVLDNDVCFIENEDANWCDFYKTQGEQTHRNLNIRKY